MKKTLFTISGSVTNSKTLKGIEGLRVEAWDKDLICDDLIGNAVTNDKGLFQIEFDSAYFQELFTDRQPDLFFKVFYKGTVIKNTEDSVLWNVHSGDIPVTIEVSIPAAVEQQRTLLITGILLNANNGYPLAGLLVKAYRIEPVLLNNHNSSDVKHQKKYLLAEGAADSTGYFSLSLNELELLECNFVLSVESQAGVIYFVSEPYARLKSTTRINLLVPFVVSAVDPSIWKALGKRLQEARLVQLHELVRQLSGTHSGNTIFGDWDLAVRHAILTELEHAFLDPDGVLRKYAQPPTFDALHSSVFLRQYRQELEPYLEEPGVQKAFTDMLSKLKTFSNLLDVDWVISPDDFKQGSLSMAVNKFSSLYNLAETAQEDLLGALQMPSELSRYRDYLRTIFTGSAGTETYLYHRGRLEKRFHQDFETLDIYKKSANSILITILKDILTSPAGDEYGFNFLVTYIEFQGKKNDRDYLDYLIGLTQLSAKELGLRYRLNFEQSDSVTSNKVQENITTLQRFYSDSFQCEAEPFPIILQKVQGKAPFFLYYEEWIQYKKPFHPENYLDYRRPFIHFENNAVAESVSIKAQAHSEPGLFGVTEEARKGFAWFALLLNLQDKLETAHNRYRQGQYGIADSVYAQANLLAKELIFNKGMPESADKWLENVTYGDFLSIFAGSLELNKKYVIENLDDLNRFINRPSMLTEQTLLDWEIYSNLSFFQWVTSNWFKLYKDLISCYFYELPLCRAEVALALGRYVEASKHYSAVSSFTIASATESDSGYLHHGYYYWEVDRNVGINNDFDSQEMFTDGQIPYSVYKGDTSETGTMSSIAELAVANFNPIIIRSSRLHHGAAIIEWADTLYRSDEEANISRARELYKAVLFLHGEMPPIEPDWPDGKITVPHWKQHSENPALTSQKTHAYLGLYQIDAGLNYYGYSESMVPLLRYKTLKNVAERFAESAKSAQQDFLLYTGNLEKLLEEALRENLITANALKKAYLLGKIAMEQADIAQQGVKQAEQQVAAVRANIAAKQQEIDDSDSLFSQFTDFAEGFVNAVSDPEKVASGLAGGNLATGYGLFIYGSYSSMGAMEDAANSRKSELNALKYQALPTAQALVGVRQKEKNIAGLQYQLAQSDAEFARALSAALSAFQENRFLNAELWARLASVMKRIMRRYLELGARYAWKAERALAYEQDRSIRIVRFDYFPVALQGVTGADLLKLDLAELEVSYLDNIKRTIPIKRTYSLAFDFPLQFSQLNKTGKCSFRTEELPFQYAYPGSYGYRIRSVSASVQKADVIPQIVGLLKNDGVSAISLINGKKNISRRDPDVFPLSEFNLKSDMALYDLPNESLFAFEGSGIETSWELELPKHANPGVKNILDVLLTFDMRAHYSESLYRQHIDSQPISVQRLVLLSARKLAPQSLLELQNGASTVTLNFNFQTVHLPENEFNRKIKNLMLFLVTKNPCATKVSIQSTLTPAAVNFNVENGYLASNLGPLSGSAIASPLNGFLDQDVGQNFELIINVLNNPNVNFSEMTDIVFGIEYAADY